MGLQDDIAYVGILIASIVFGYVFRKIPITLRVGSSTFEARK